MVSPSTIWVKATHFVWVNNVRVAARCTRPSTIPATICLSARLHPRRHWAPSFIGKSVTDGRCRELVIDAEHKGVLYILRLHRRRARGREMHVAEDHFGCRLPTGAPSLLIPLGASQTS